MTRSMVTVFFVLLACSCSALDVKFKHAAGEPHLRVDSPVSFSAYPQANITSLALMKLATDCHCAFHGVCSCDQAMVFMNCIADACSSGRCMCEGSKFLNACNSMGSTCPQAGLICTEGAASCPNSAAVNYEGIASIIDDLEILRERKCQLELWHKKGQINSQLRLQELAPKIAERLETLKVMSGGASLNMGCSPADLAAFEAGRQQLLEEAKAKMHERWHQVAAPAIPTPPSWPTVPAVVTPPPAVPGMVPPEPTAPETVAVTQGNFLRALYYAFIEFCLVLLLPNLVYILFAIICAYVYNQHRKDPRNSFFPDVSKMAESPTESWSKGNSLFSCFTDPKFCLFTCCCPSIRWADTVDRFFASSADKRAPSKGSSKIFNYWVAFLVMLILMVFADESLGFAYIAMVALGVYCRQRIRQKYTARSGDAQTICLDIWTWFFCPACAIAQEAREEAMHSTLSPP